jgi:hypothetical protein
MRAPITSPNRNWIPVTLAFAPAFLLPITQEVLRPAFRHAPLLGCCFTIAAEAAVEYSSPFGPNTFDVHDLIATGAGVGMALVSYTPFVRRQLGSRPPISEYLSK